MVVAAHDLVLLGVVVAEMGKGGLDRCGGLQYNLIGKPIPIGFHSLLTLYKSMDLLSSLRLTAV